MANFARCFFWLLSTFVLLLPRSTESQSKPAADLIITNAKVWTVDESLPMAQAVAVLGDRIVSVGSNAAVDAWHDVGCGPGVTATISVLGDRHEEENIDGRGAMTCRSGENFNGSWGAPSDVVGKIQNLRQHRAVAPRSFITRRTKSVACPPI